jgi:hypothetical protein
MRFSPKFNEYRTFGIEIEFKISIRDGQTVAYNLSQESGVAVAFRGYTHEVMRTWKLITDASVTGGFELVSPPLSGLAGLEEVRKMMRALVTLGASVDRQCGLHVHHNAADLTPDELAGLVVFHTQFENVIDTFHPMSRRSNNYAQSRYYPIEKQSAEQIRAAGTLTGKRDLFDQNYGSGQSRNSRYRKLNTQSFRLYGTVEFRQHAGTLNGTKATNWILFTQLLVEKAKCGVDITPRAKISFGELMRALRMGMATPEIAHLRNYYYSRMISLRRNGGEE